MEHSCIGWRNASRHPQPFVLKHSICTFRAFLPDHFKNACDLCAYAGAALSGSIGVERKSCMTGLAEICAWAAEAAAADKIPHGGSAGCRRIGQDGFALAQAEEFAEKARFLFFVERCAGSLQKREAAGAALDCSYDSHGTQPRFLFILCASAPPRETGFLLKHVSPAVALRRWGGLKPAGHAELCPAYAWSFDYRLLTFNPIVSQPA
jgi:hypothetical protein